MIRIAKMPFIQEDTDRWGVPRGTFSVIDIQGDVEEEMWAKVQEYEGYYISEEGRAEAKAVEEASGKTAYELSELTPHFKKVIGYSNSVIWQFNLRVSQSEDLSEALYIRSYAVFGEKTLHEWTPEHDQKVLKLRLEALKLSQ